MATNKWTMIELFAGVGGFRAGLELFGWKTVFANQWEPGKTKQWAFDCYTSHFPDGINSNVDIAKVKSEDIPAHSLLVGGFPCQDYSVAATLATSKGINGKKGVLWWEIRRIAEKKKPKYILLENVDRLLKSPASQRGRDFGIILSCLNSLGYSVEWRIINAADFGFPQRRRRTFIFATRRAISNKLYGKKSALKIIAEKGFFAKTFPIAETSESESQINTTYIPKDLVHLTNEFSSEFLDSGFCQDFICTSIKTTPSFAGPFVTLGDVLEKNVPEKYYIKETDLQLWKYMKGAKHEQRKTKTGYEYFYSEGPIAYPDCLDKPSRTMLTSESSKNRSTHVILDPETNKMRILTPVECERLNGFPDNWTSIMPEKTRYFCMGNALVVGLISRMAETITNIERKF